MRITDFWEAIRALMRVGSGTFETTLGTFHARFDGYESSADSDRGVACVYVLGGSVGGLIYEDQFIALEVPDEA